MTDEQKFAEIRWNIKDYYSRMQTQINPEYRGDGVEDAGFLLDEIDKLIQQNAIHERIKLELQAQNAVMRAALEHIQEYWNGCPDSAVDAIEEAISTADAALAADLQDARREMAELKAELHGARYLIGCHERHIKDYDAAVESIRDNVETSTRERNDQLRKAGYIVVTQKEYARMQGVVDVARAYVQTREKEDGQVRSKSGGVYIKLGAALEQLELME